MQGEATDPGRLAILNARRNAVLDERHFRESSLTALITCVTKYKRKTAAGINAPKL